MSGHGPVPVDVSDLEEELLIAPRSVRYFLSDSTGVDFAAHAASMGAIASRVSSLGDLERALQSSKANDRTTVIVIDTDPLITTQDGGHWWDVAVPEVSPRPQVNAARKAYEEALKYQR